MSGSPGSPTALEISRPVYILNVTLAVSCGSDGLPGCNEFSPPQPPSNHVANKSAIIAYLCFNIKAPIRLNLYSTICPHSGILYIHIDISSRFPVDSHRHSRLHIVTDIYTAVVLTTPYISIHSPAGSGSVRLIVFRVILSPMVT